MNVHFIAVGGAVMHNMAIALHIKGYNVTGSDDQIFDPSRGRLDKYGLLPDKEGWDANRINADIDAVILGMHAREDNPELAKARELGLKIYSFPEYVYEQTKDKTRVVIGGSHGKTSITSMILHVLNELNIENDYLVGAQLDGFECMVRLSDTAKVVILEGDEYLSSPLDRRPKFHLYHPHVALLSGIAWDHINVFPTFEMYKDQFRLFAEMVSGTLTYCEEDNVLSEVVQSANTTCDIIPYKVHPHRIENGKTVLITAHGEFPLKIFGDHNLQNLNGALNVCKAIGVEEKDFYTAITSFKGAARRLELIIENESCSIYKDFAHSPSKLKATTAAVKKQFDNRELIACMELHTFSSLNKEFLAEYEGSMATADRAIVFFNPKTVEHKRLEPISKEDVLQAFNSPNVEVVTDALELQDILKGIVWKDRNLLLMSSGNFGGMNVDEFAKSVI